MMAMRVLMACGGMLLACLAACNSQSSSTPTKAAEPAKAASPADATPTASQSAAPSAPVKAPSTTPAPPPKAPPPPAPKAAAAPAKAERLASDDPEHKDWFISIEKAKEIFDKKEVNKKQVIFIDARTYIEFTEGHIRGAMCYSTKYTEGPPQPKARNYLPGSAIVIYCHGDLCTDSVQVGKYFQSLHMDIGPVFIIKDGFPAWKAAFPNLIDKGPEVGFD